ncbi:MAG TPA: thiamine-phosphate kinase [Hyphomicrobiaceae bacterium]|nr:thiamine-phosphate kinase [Hyphomicrobiaceae bacterium]
MTSEHQEQRLHGEEALIRLLAPLTNDAPGAFGLADDCALIAVEPGAQLVLKTDPVAEGVHFFGDDAPEDIGWKALAVNASDLAAKAARPLGYLMALSFPEAPTTAWFKRFAAGLMAAQTAFGCRLLGGDTDRRPGPITITITILGTVAAHGMVRRGTAEPGDELFVSGTLGDAFLGLALRKDAALSDRWGLTREEAQHLIQRFLRPQPRLALASALRAHASAAMDLSDGLAKDLARMCGASGCAGSVRLADVPLSTAAAKAAAVDPTLAVGMVTSGDDYEVLAAVPAANAEAFRSCAAGDGIPVSPIGSMRAGSGVVIEDGEGRPLVLNQLGWDHF